MIADRVLRIPPSRMLTRAFLWISELQAGLYHRHPSLDAFSYSVSKAQPLHDEMELLKVAVHRDISAARPPLCIYDTSYVDNYASTIDLQGMQLYHTVRPPTASINWPFVGNELTSVYRVYEMVYRAARVT